MRWWEALVSKIVGEGEQEEEEWSGVARGEVRGGQRAHLQTHPLRCS